MDQTDTENGHPSDADAKETLRLLAAQLEERLQLIGDTEFRNRDRDAHLNALRSIAAKIDELASEPVVRQDPELGHYMKNASYQKALERIETLLQPIAHDPNTRNFTFR